MSQSWSQMMELTEQNQMAITAFYEQAGLPYEIRYELAPWFEAQDWTLGEGELCFRDPRVGELLHQRALQLGRLIDERVAGMDRNAPSCLRWIHFHHQLGHSPIERLRTIGGCLRYEATIIGNARQGSSAAVETSGLLFATARDEFKETETICQQIAGVVEEMNLKHDHYQQIDQRAPEANLLCAEITQLCQQYQQSKELLLARQEKLLIALKTLHDGPVGEQLKSWKQQQLRSAPDTFDNIVQVKEACETISRHLCNLLNQLKCLETLLAGCRYADTDSAPRFAKIKNAVIDHLRVLLNDTFVVRKQPVQLLKKDKIFQADVCLLVANVLNQHISLPEVEVNIIDQTEARRLYDNPKHVLVHCGELLNKLSRFKYHESGRTLCANFGKLQLTDISRKTQRESRVTERKSALVFATEFAIDENVRVNVRVLSAPVVMITQSSQECNAHAAIAWDNAFAQPDRAPFDVLTEVRFGDLAERVFSQMFYNIGRHLTPENIQFLACKLLGRFDLPDPSNEIITWTKLSKDNLPAETSGGLINTTFWKWFYETWRLTKKHLADMWRADFILGFVHKSRANEILRTSEPGTFLVRFSDSLLGAVSLATLVIRDEKPVIFMVQPLAAQDLTLCSLANRLRHFKELVWLFPGRDKEMSLGKFYSMPSVGRDYVSPLTTNLLPEAPEHLKDTQQL